MRYFEMKSSRLTVEKQVSSCLDVKRTIEWNLLYPPHMRRLPVKADLPCSTRQLSKTV
jgi:hypothetical protein